MKRTRKFLQSLKEGNLGDAIKVVTDAAGIEQCDECKKRQQDWNFGKKNNKLWVPYEDFEVLRLYVEEPRGYMNHRSQRVILNILEKVYNTKLKTTSCASCWANKINPKIYEVYNFNKENGES